MTDSVFTSSIRHCKRLASMSAVGGPVERELVLAQGKPLVILHKQHAMLEPHFTASEWRAFSESVELPESLQQEVDGWNRNLRFSLNCHTVAIGAFLGMRGKGWLEGSRGQATLMANPAQDLLDGFFDEIMVGRHVTDVSDVEHDDVIVFRDSAAGELVHSGRIRMLGCKTLLLSKFGEHPIAIVPLEATVQPYEGQFDQVIVYRWRG